MTTTKTKAKAKPAGSKQQWEHRRIVRLMAAWAKIGKSDPQAAVLGLRSYKMLRAAVYAITPGRQRAANIHDLLDKATGAACRALRTTGKVKP